MLRRILPLGLPLALLTAGCIPTDQPDTRLVQPNRFDTSTVPQPKLQQVSYTAGTPETGRRVGEVGEKLIQANRQKIGIRPIFRTSGTPQPEVFHLGTGQVVISEGLVKQCRTDGELAAVLALELGKMAAEREQQAGGRMVEREPPPYMPIGNDLGGPNGPADMTRQAELAQFQQHGGRPSMEPTPPPDPKTLARGYLLQAGYQENDLDFGIRLQQGATSGGPVETQLTTTPRLPQGAGR